MTMTERLLEATKEIWAGYNEKPFVKGIADGSLDHDKFKYYMIQDYLYLIDYTKVFALGAASQISLDTFNSLSVVVMPSPPQSLFHGNQIHDP